MTVTRIILFSAVFILNRSIAQIKEPNLINITQQEGLPSNETYCVFKDSKNYIWVATDQGVVRFKGNTMQVINNLPDNVVFKIKEDHKGRIWFFSRSFQLAYFFNEKVVPYQFNNKLREKIHSDILLDAWISGADEIIINSQPDYNYVINTLNGAVVELKYTNKNTWGKFTLNIDRINDSFYFAQKIAAYKYGFNHLVIKNNNNVYTILSGFQSDFQFYGASSTNGEDVFFYIGKLIIKLSPDGTYKMKQLDREILTMQYNKKKGSINLGLRLGGAVQVDTNNLGIVELYPALNTKSVTGIGYDNEGGEWFTTLENGVYYGKYQQVSKIIDDKVFRIFNFRDSVLLFATNKGLFQYYKNDILPLAVENNRAVNDIQIDKEGNILFAVFGDTIKRRREFNYQCKKIVSGLQKTIYAFNSSTELSLINETYYFGQGFVLLSFNKNKNKDYYFTELHQQMPDRGLFYCDNQERLWLGGLRNIYQYNINNNNFQVFKDSSFIKGVTSMRQMSNGIYVIGLRFGGMVLMRDSTIIGTITEKDGLLSNSAKYILPVGNRIWLAAPDGISVIEFSSYTPLQYRILNFSENAGLNNMLIYQLITFRDNILAATSKGVYQFNNIEQSLTQQPVPIPLYITTLSYYKGDTSGISNITLPYEHNRLVVSFDAVCYNTPKELEYYYRTGNGGDTIWHSINSTQIILENPAPGNYKLQIKAVMPKQQRYSAIQTLNITITKPWWQWNFIRIAAVLILLSLIYWLYLWRIRRIKKREKAKTALKKQMTELEQTALRSQMNPHFIFNCLSSIQQLLVVGNKDEANDYLVKFARLIRKTLELSVNPYISLAQEIDYLSEYMVLEQLRLPGQFYFYFVIDNNIDINATEIPNMMLQPIVENCIRHGIKHLQDKKGKITISIAKMNDCLHCEVSDNGVGRKKAGSSFPEYTTHKSFGLGIVEKRLTGLPNYNPGKYFVKIFDNFNEEGILDGTKVILQLPIKLI